MRKTRWIALVVVLALAGVVGAQQPPACPEGCSSSLGTLFGFLLDLQGRVNALQQRIEALEEDDDFDPGLPSTGRLENILLGPGEDLETAVRRTRTEASRAAVPAAARATVPALAPAANPGPSVGLVATPRWAKTYATVDVVARGPVALRVEGRGEPGCLIESGFNAAGDNYLTMLPLATGNPARVKVHSETAGERRLTLEVAWPKVAAPGWRCGCPCDVRLVSNGRGAITWSGVVPS